METLHLRQQALLRSFQTLQRLAFSTGTTTVEYNKVALEVDELHNRLAYLEIPPGELFDEYVDIYLLTGQLPGTDEFDIQ